MRVSGRIHEGQAPGPDLVDRVVGGRHQDEQRPGVEESARGTDDDEGAGEADRDRHPARQPDPLAEQREREDGDDDRRGEHQRGRGRELDEGKGGDEAGVRDEEDERAHGLGLRPRGAKDREATARPEKEHHPEEMPEEARPHHLPRGVLAGEVLRDGVHRGDQARPEHHERDCDERLPAGGEDHCGEERSRKPVAGSLRHRAGPAGERAGAAALPVFPSRYLVSPRV